MEASDESREPVIEVPARCHPSDQREAVLRETSHRYLTSWPLALVTFSLCLGTFTVALDVNIIGTAVPKIAAVFSSLDDIAWYGSAYLLTITAFQPTLGFVYKYFDIKITYLASIVLFEVGSTLCAAAPTSSSFILGRAIAGFGAAGLLQGCLAVIGYIVPLERRPMFMGIVISVFGISVCTGPVLGGAFTDNLSWRWCFWINLPIGAIAILLVIVFLRPKGAHDANRNTSLKTKFEHMDVLGTVLFLAATCCLILALQWGGQSLPWNSSRVIGLFTGSAVLGIVFGFLQWKRGEDAIIPIRILRQRSILMGSSYLFFFGMLNYVYSFFIPFYFQAVQGASATSSGIRIIPLVLPQIVVLTVTGAVVTRWGYYVPYMIFGQILCVVGAGLLTRIGLGTTTVEWASYLVLTGLGMGMSQVLPYTAVQVVLSESDVPTGNAIVVFANQFGGVVAIPTCQALLLNTIKNRLAHYTTAVTPEALNQAGPFNLVSLSHSDPIILEALRQVYSIGLRRTYILALSAGCAAAVCTLGMERKNVKSEEKRRLEISSSGEELGSIRAIE